MTLFRTRSLVCLIYEGGSNSKSKLIVEIDFYNNEDHPHRKRLYIRKKCFTCSTGNVKWPKARLQRSSPVVEESRAQSSNCQTYCHCVSKCLICSVPRKKGQQATQRLSFVYSQVENIIEKTIFLCSNGKREVMIENILYIQKRKKRSQFQFNLSGLNEV